MLACLALLLTVMTPLHSIVQGFSAANDAQNCGDQVPSGSAFIDPNHARLPTGKVVTFSPPNCQSRVTPTITNQWVEQAVNTQGPFSSISAQWTVPNGPNPSSPTGQTLIYFDGLEGYWNGGSQFYILQPVLAWGAIGGCSVGGNYWYRSCLVLPKLSGLPSHIDHLRKRQRPAYRFSYMDN